MKKLNFNTEVVFRFAISAFVFCMTGVMMQIVEPLNPDSATTAGIVFFVLGLVFGAVSWMLRIPVHRERMDAVCEADRRSHTDRNEPDKANSDRD